MFYKSSHKTRSVASISSKTSISSAVAIARAKAEAAKMRATFADKEVQLKVEKAEQEGRSYIEKARLDSEKAYLDSGKARLDCEKARLDIKKAEEEQRAQIEKACLNATLEKLAAENEAAAALAEAECLEAAQNPELQRQDSILSLKFIPQDASQRTSQYVIELPDSNCDAEPVSTREHVSDETNRIQHEARPQVRYKLENITRGNSADDNLATHQVAEANYHADMWYTRPKQYDTGWLHPEATNRYERTPHHYQGDPSPVYPADNRVITDFAKFFAQRDLVTKGLLKFNDQAEGYRAWKASFQNITTDLGLPHREEIDLLVKYLGEESGKHAARIRDININHPEVGLKMIWNRLDECYGSAEAIEKALFKRIDDFPKISNKGLQKLRGLSDLLMEFQVAKCEENLQGLAFLDTARVVNPIVQKLPYNLQERWLTHGSTYKYKHGVPFPPFSVFVEFVHQQAKIRNDPSFDFTISYATPSPAPNLLKTSVAVDKTNVSSGFVHRSASDSHVQTKAQDPIKQCPLHQKPHSLLRCRASRGKPMPDRKSVLKENGICYKCCLSTTSLAKDCKEAHILNATIMDRTTFFLPPPPKQPVPLCHH
ncbi:uncharacterized protein ACNLHF_004040 [Anomaloglossus baeobatrachus]